jgi:CheY-like chemotaxis protein
MFGDRSSFQNALRGLRILIVDDLRETRILLNDFLSYAGASVVSASSGPAAIALLSDEIDVVIVDIQMPEVCGIETAKMMREKEFIGVIVAMSAGQYPDSETRFPNPTFDSFVYKPYEFKTIVSAILSGFEG